MKSCCLRQIDRWDFVCKDVCVLFFFFDQQTTNIRYAEAGQVIAGHLSVVDAGLILFDSREKILDSRTMTGTSLYGVCYSTVRDQVTEDATIQFIRAINFTGFGAVWWWQGVDNK